MSQTGPDSIRDFVHAYPDVSVQGNLSIRSLLDAGDPSSIAKAINMCIKCIKGGGVYERKGAYFILGQIGDAVALEVLEKAISREQTEGLICAAKAGRDAILNAPRSKGTSENERCIVIENSYWEYGNPKLAMMKKMGVSPSESQKKSSGCFIATAVYGSPLAEEVIWLSRFRDEVLSKHGTGRSFIRIYYASSPRIASVISKSAVLRFIMRSIVVRPATRLVKRLLVSKGGNNAVIR